MPVILFLYLFFLLLCGKCTLEILLFDLLVSLAVFAFSCAFLSHSLRREILIYRLLPFALSYLLLLLWEILKAAIGVAGVIYRGENPGEGKLVRFSSGLRSELARTVLADSITLTPGTVTVEMRGDEFLVHCLLPSYGEGLADCSFVRRLRRLDAILMKEKEKERSV